MSLSMIVLVLFGIAAMLVMVVMLTVELWLYAEHQRVCGKPHGLKPSVY